MKECNAFNFGDKIRIDRYLRKIFDNRKLVWLSRDDEKDILQEGRIAFWKAKENFYSTKDCKFTTYALPRVR